MTINGLNTEPIVPLLRGIGANKDIAVAEQIVEERFNIKSTADSADKKSRLITDSKLVSSNEAAYIKPQYEKNTPVSSSEKSDKAYYNSVNFNNDVLIEEAEYYMEEERGFPEGYEFPKNSYQPSGYFITLPKEHLDTSYKQHELTAAQQLKQKFYASEIRTGTLINVVL